MSLSCYNATCPEKDFWSYGEKITGAELLKWSNNSVVYGWFREDECLYIGQTGRGIKRVITHDVINVIEPVLETDEIRFFPTNDLADRLDLELTLIKRHRPLFNIRDNKSYPKQPRQTKPKLPPPKVEDIVATLPNLHKVKSIYIPSQL